MNRSSVSTRPSRRIAAGIAGAAIAVAGVAGASWSAQGTGNAKAKAGRLEAVTASPASPASELFPGGSADAALTLTNPNPIAMAVSSIAGNGAITSDSAECDAAGNGVTFTTQQGAWEVANGATLAVSLPNAVRMSTEAPDACQGATFTIPVAIVASASGQGAGNTPSTQAASQLQWSPASFAFPNTEPGSMTPTSQEFTLTNIGSGNASIETGALGNGDFPVEVNNCTGTSLSPGQACAVRLRFAPSSPGPKSATLQARASGAQAWTTATVSGLGVMPATLQVSPGGHDFGGFGVGAESAAFVFTVQNASQSTAFNVAPQLQGLDPGSFVIRANDCPGTLSAGASCSIGITFRPEHTGSNVATLRVVYHNTTATAPAATAQLNGTGA